MDVLVTDATTTGRDTARLLLRGVPALLTLRDLIRFRVREEVARHNAGVLSLILSKALLLAADDKVTDPTILHQLERRA
jgi:hypothetical protein